MGGEVRDAVVVDDGQPPVHLDQLVARPQAVLDDEQRLAPAVPEIVEDDAQPDRVDLPSHSELGRVGLGTPPMMLPLPARTPGSAEAHTLM